MTDEKMKLTVDRTAAMLSMQHELLTTLVARLPNAQQVLEDFSAFSKAMTDELKAEAPHLDFSQYDLCRQVLLDNLEFGIERIRKQ